MNHYNLMPVEGNWYDNQELIDKCGSLFPFITTKAAAIKYAKSVKREFPNVKFELTIGKTWGSQELVLEL